MNLQNATITLIGCGQMGSAILQGLARHTSSSSSGAPTLYLCDRDEARAQNLAEALGGEMKSLADVSEINAENGTRVFLLAVKPHQLLAVIEAIAWREGDVLISVAAGVTMRALEGAIAAPDPGVHVVRTMPNTPALVGAGITGIFANTPQGATLARELFESVGEVVELDDEEKFHGLTAVSGSGPAYVFTFLEALADGGVLAGLDRATAKRLAVETLAGAAELVRQSESLHTAELKDRVASPAGTTIAALRELERGALRHTVINAVEAAARRSKELGK